MQNKFKYPELRDEIHKIFFDLLDRELACCEKNEFDFEYLESKTDEILRLIKRQGGTF